MAKRFILGSFARQHAKSDGLCAAHELPPVCNLVKFYLGDSLRKFFHTFWLT
jgi:hypothetical protein